MPYVKDEKRRESEGRTDKSRRVDARLSALVCVMAKQEGVIRSGSGSKASLPGEGAGVGWLGRLLQGLSGCRHMQ